MSPAGIGIGYFGDDLTAVFHRQEHGFIVPAIRILFDAHAGLGTDGICGDTGELIDVEPDMALSHLMCFIADETSSSKAKKIIVVLQAWSASISKGLADPMRQLT